MSGLDAADDEELALSASTFAALQKFYKDRDAHAQKFAKLQAAAEEQHADGPGSGAAEQKLPVPLTMEAFSEDWNESQFWYSDDTANILAKQLLEGAPSAENTIVVVSAPSVFVALKNLVAAKDASFPRPNMFLLEHDNRFAVFGSEFIFYDFAQPTKLPSHLKATADCIMCDPPFLSEDCQTKAALTVRWLSKRPATRLIVCTGERMEYLVTQKLYRALGLRTTDFEPVHARNLGNEFRCYANFGVDGEGKGWKRRQRADP